MSDWEQATVSNEGPSMEILYRGIKGEILDFA